MQRVPRSRSTVRRALVGSIAAALGAAMVVAACSLGAPAPEGIIQGPTPGGFDAAAERTVQTDSALVDTATDTGISTDIVAEPAVDADAAVEADSTAKPDAAEAGIPCGPECKLISGPATGTATCVEQQCKIVCFPPTSSLKFTDNGPACVDPDTDPFFCHGTMACGPGEICRSGVCDPASECALGMEWCGGRCVNPQNDLTMCGGCPGGVACDAGVSCVSGRCVEDCPSGIWCNEACTAWVDDPTNCGTCWRGCDPGEFCGGGECRTYVYASGCWECALRAEHTECCELGTAIICVSLASPGCPQGA